MSFPSNFTFYKWCVTKVAHCIVSPMPKQEMLSNGVGGATFDFAKTFSNQLFSREWVTSILN